MNLTQAVVWLKRVRKAIPLEVSAEQKAFAEYAKTVMVVTFSGSTSLAELRKKNHPYGRGPMAGGRGPIPYGNAAIVNAHSGVARTGWVLVAVPGGWRLTNTDRVVAFLFYGTSRMISRPFREQVLSIVLPQRLPRMKRALQRAIK